MKNLLRSIRKLLGLERSAHQDEAAARIAYEQALKDEHRTREKIAHMMYRDRWWRYPHL